MGEINTGQEIIQPVIAAQQSNDVYQAFLLARDLTGVSDAPAVLRDRQLIRGIRVLGVLPCGIVPDHALDQLGATATLFKPFRPSRLINWLVDVSERDNEAIRNASPLSYDPAKVRTRRVLLVDDNPMVLNVAAHMLEKLGCDITRATNGREAVEIYQNECFDLIFMDHMMPEIDGPDASV